LFSSGLSTAQKLRRFIRSVRPISAPDWLRTVTLSFRSGRIAEEVVVDDGAAGMGEPLSSGLCDVERANEIGRDLSAISFNKQYQLTPLAALPPESSL
jgi:hypothetical protein